MTIASAGALLEITRKLGLLSHSQAAHVPRLVPSGADARALAKTLVQQGWLTVYQINQLLLGKGQQLVLGPYHILELLGRGGLSTVFKARHADFGWQVALKILTPEALENDLGRQQFLREMEAMTLLDHANIVQFCDLDQVGAIYYYAMEYVDGTDLGKLVGLMGRLPVHEACEYICQTALGLQHAHEHNLIHRDIKPVNLFLTHDPSGPHDARGKPALAPLIKILDWGLAALRFPVGSDLAPPGDEGLSAVLGTADFLAPEQARSPVAADIRSDIYSLGCTLYFLLTGQPPFPEGNLMQKIMQHQQAKPRPIAEFRRDVPEELCAVLERMLAKHPDERFQTPAALALALQPFAQPHPSAVSFAKEILGLKDIIMSSIPRDRTPLPRALANLPSPGER